MRWPRFNWFAIFVFSLWLINDGAFLSAFINLFPDQYSDFTSYYTAAWMLNHGNPHIFDWATFSEVALHLGLGALPYAYTPLFAWALSPLAQFNYYEALYLWLIFNILISLGLILALRKLFPERPSWLFALILLMPSLWDNLFVGQVSTLILFILVAILGESVGKFGAVLRAMSLAWAAALKSSFLALLPLNILRGHLAETLLAIFFQVGILIIGLISLGLPFQESFAAYRTAMGNISQLNWYVGSNDGSAWGFSGAFFGPQVPFEEALHFARKPIQPFVGHHPLLFLLAGLALASGVFVLASLHTRFLAARGAARRVTGAFFLSTMPLIMPAAWAHTDVFYLPILLHLWPSQGSSLKYKVTLGVGLVFTTTTFLLYLLNYYSYSYLGHLPIPVLFRFSGRLILWGLFILRTRESDR